MGVGLEGITVLDLTRIIPGPYCSLLLADLGCDVIKIEDPAKGDYTRDMEPPVFCALNRNKRSLTLNLKEAQGRKIFYSLAKKADVILESFRPGVVKKLGIDYGSIRKIKKGIIYCSISGFGQDGPYKNRPGHDLDYMAMAGVFSISKVTPHVLPIHIADFSSGMFAAISILAALIGREKLGEGQYIDISLMDSIISLASTKLSVSFKDKDKSGRGTETQYAGFGIFKTEDNRFLSLSALEDNFWRKLCDTLSHSGYGFDYKEMDLEERFERLLELNQVLCEIIETKSLRTWLEIFQESDIPCAPVNLLEEVPLDPQVLHRELIFEMNHPRFGKMRQVRFPAKFSLMSPSVRMPPPDRGEHTVEILKSLGHDEREIEKLRRSGAI
jgi:crotonobetainyl-CoA:carnitine CoA-transferase CaiB-like acyl-CoA transferase